VIAPAWPGSLAAFLWQVALHSAIAGFLFYAWARRRRLPPGRTRRRLLAVLLVLPMVTAAIPGRTGPEFRERLAWLDSERVLAIPVGAGFHLLDLAILLGLATVGITVWQEVLGPVLRRPATGPAALPEPLVRLVRGLPGWERCDIRSSPVRGILLATGGWPWRPRLIVSRDAVIGLAEAELAAVIRHEHAHWQAGRFMRSHALFLVRLLQCHNPVALWTFREYCLEVEIECDAAAVGGQDPGTLTRTLLAVTSPPTAATSPPGASCASAPRCSWATTPWTTTRCRPRRSWRPP
jgi:hypothetical protein